VPGALPVYDLPTPRRPVTERAPGGEGSSAGRALGIRRRVRVIESARLTSPIAFGLLRPTVGLPAGFRHTIQPRETRRDASARAGPLGGHDPFWCLLADAATVLLWWHPGAGGLRGSWTWWLPSYRGGRPGEPGEPAVRGDFRRRGRRGRWFGRDWATATLASGRLNAANNARCQRPVSNSVASSSYFLLSLMPGGRPRLCITPTMTVMAIGAENLHHGRRRAAAAATTRALQVHQPLHTPPRWERNPDTRIARAPGQSGARPAPQAFASTWGPSATSRLASSAAISLPGATAAATHHTPDATRAATVAASASRHQKGSWAAKWASLVR